MEEDPRLKRQQDYQQFHIGIYVTLATGVIAATLFGKDAMPSCLLKPWPLAVAIGSLMGAGICGGIMASKLPEANDYEKFLRTRIGVSLLGHHVRIMRPKNWEAFEHLFFWLAMVDLGGYAVWVAFHR